MDENRHSENFEQIVEWAYRTLPEEIRKLPDFPGIQVVDEPPPAIFERKNRQAGKELLGCYSGIRRAVRQHNDVRQAPDLIFVFRGPILRCSRGDLRAEVKEVVWHEVAHWLGHSEKEIEELGLATLKLPVGQAKKTLPAQFADTVSGADETKEFELRCVKCYSADVTCRELDKPLTTASWLGEPTTVHTRICICNSCGHEWDDEENR
jgi:predicted Zn-dependent protease with MMP-like domain